MFTIQSRLVSDAETKSRCQNAIMNNTLPLLHFRNILVRGHNSPLKLPHTKPQLQLDTLHVPINSPKMGADWHFGCVMLCVFCPLFKGYLYKVSVQQFYLLVLL